MKKFCFLTSMLLLVGAGYAANFTVRAIKPFPAATPPALPLVATYTVTNNLANRIVADDLSIDTSAIKGADNIKVLDDSEHPNTCRHQGLAAHGQCQFSVSLRLMSKQAQQFTDSVAFVFAKQFSYHAQGDSVTALKPFVLKTYGNLRGSSVTATYAQGNRRVMALRRFGIVLSTDNGKTFTTVLPTSEHIKRFFVFLSQWYAVVPDNGLWASADAGSSWQKVIVPFKDIVDAVPLQKRFVIATKDHGIYTTTDGIHYGVRNFDPSETIVAMAKAAGEDDAVVTVSRNKVNLSQLDIEHFIFTRRLKQVDYKISFPERIKVNELLALPELTDVRRYLLGTSEGAYLFDASGVQKTQMPLNANYDFRDFAQMPDGAVLGVTKDGGYLLKKEVPLSSSSAWQWSQAFETALPEELVPTAGGGFDVSTDGGVMPCTYSTNAGVVCSQTIVADMPNSDYRFIFPYKNSGFVAFGQDAQLDINDKGNFKPITTGLPAKPREVKNQFVDVAAIDDQDYIAAVKEKIGAVIRPYLYRFDGTTMRWDEIEIPIGDIYVRHSLTTASGTIYATFENQQQQYVACDSVDGGRSWQKLADLDIGAPAEDKVTAATSVSHKGLKGYLVAYYDSANRKAKIISLAPEILQNQASQMPVKKQDLSNGLGSARIVSISVGTYRRELKVAATDKKHAGYIRNIRSELSSKDEGEFMKLTGSGYDNAIITNNRFEDGVILFTKGNKVVLVRPVSEEKSIYQLPFAYADAGVSLKSINLNREKNNYALRLVSNGHGPLKNSTTPSTVNPRKLP